MAGQGTLYQRKSNSKFYLIINLGTKNEKGKYQQKWIDLETTDKTIAKEKRNQILADLQRKGRYDEPSKQTFGEWLDFWLNEIAKPKVKPKTYDDYEYVVRFHIKPQLGSIPLKKLSPEQLQIFYNKKQGEKKLGFKVDDSKNRLPSDKALSSRTIQKIQMIIQTSLQKAVAMRKISENPNAFLERVKYKRPQAKYLSTSQIIDLLENIIEDRWYPAFVTSLGSGLRLGELVALKWDDINFKAALIRVDETVETVKTHQQSGPKQRLNWQDPKSEKSKRVVPVPSDVIEVLGELKKRQRKEKLNGGSFYNDQGYIFSWEDGRIVQPEYLSKHFNKLAKENGFEGITFHKLRHSYATMLLEKGEDIKTIQENLGHSSSQITSDIYAHVVDAMKERAAKKIDGFTKRKTN